ncbi:chemotaxis protein CheW [Legionella sp. CNM-4043-24]|uniref:chemotaxis protein CheW n=1 Tax=Legionella sp. CNM-4043-24 TaxID=3421646 RepID=UPI00403AB0D1
MDADGDEIIREFLTESSEHLDSLDSQFVAIEKDSSDQTILSSIFRSIHTIKGGAGMLGFHHLEKLTHAAENLLSLLRDGKLQMTMEISTTLLQTVDAVRCMLDCISKTCQDGEEEYLSLIDTLTRLQTVPTTSAQPEPAMPVQPAPEIPVQSAPEEQVANDSQGLESSELKSALSTDTSIRINVTILDKLMNLVGELVLSRNQVLQCVTTQSDPNFISISQRLNLITSELQEGIMKTRMQPIGNIWNKFSRVVRDLAVTCNKKVKLEMHGQETELDKTLIEAIKDPMIHIMRNSMDHGIEPPEVRKARGKPEQGTLRLNAFHEGGYVNIEVTDDGGGISADKVKSKAVAKGLISAEQAARMSEHEAINLVFLPGLSTAEQITNVSGRGVGMDVVRTNIERINGTIDIQSKAGISTSLRIKIPLTLAIVPALIVTCENSRYAIPQTSLLELVRLETEEITQHIQFIKDTPVYKLRGKILPLIYLSKELRLTNESTSNSANEVISIVVLQAGETRFGLVVDNINDTQEIVVKPLNKFFKNLQAFSGATIMGDGKISLILDPVGLAQKAGLISFNTQKSNAVQSAHSHAESFEKQSLLLVRSGNDNLMAIMLDKVERIEEFPASSIEKSGLQEVVQYRNSIMPLIRLSKFINTNTETLSVDGKIQVIVCMSKDKSYGFIIDQVYDVVEGVFDLQQEISRPGVLGTTVVEGKVTELLDIDAILCTALPNYFNIIEAA